MAGSSDMGTGPKRGYGNTAGIRYICLSGHDFGVLSRGCDPGPPLLAQ